MRDLTPRRLLYLLIPVLLAGCGGGSGGSAGGGVVAPPATSPTPTPTPTSTPTPAALVRAFAASPLIGQLTLQSTAGGPAVMGYTSRQGEYFIGFRNGIIVGEAQGGGATPGLDRSTWSKLFVGVDAETLLRFQLNASAEAKVVSPLTSLVVFGASDQAKLKEQFGVTGSVFGLSIDPDLANFDALKELASGEAARVADGGRMAAANLRVLAVQQGIGASFSGDRPEEASRQSRMDTIGSLGPCLNALPPSFLFQNARMTALIECERNAVSGLRPMRAATISAVAHLVNAYAAAIPLRVETADERARWLLGINGYLQPAIALLSAADSDAAAAAALTVTTQDILDQTARYVDHYSFGPTDLFVAGPEFLTVASGATQTVETNFLRENDWEFQGLNGMTIAGTVTSVIVPAGNTGEVQASLMGGNVSVKVASGFRGATYFDYVTRNAAGLERSGRVYVRAY